MTDWILALMFALQPEAPWTDSYLETAQAIADVSERDSLFKGDDGPRRTAALLVSLAWFESRYDQEAIGDHGRSCGIHQVQPRTSQRYTCEELQDPAVSAKEAIRLIRISMRICHSLAPEERLSWYTSGSCNRGARESRNRLNLAARLASK
jgi:membrane-bound lytic murein transglycosylase MltF